MSIISRDTFIVDEIEVFRAVKKWMEHNNKAKEDAANLLKAVRLCEIPPRELFGEVECSGLYSKDDIYGAIRIQQKPDWNSTLPRGRIDGMFAMVNMHFVNQADSRQILSIKTQFTCRECKAF